MSNSVAREARREPSDAPSSRKPPRRSAFDLPTLLRVSANRMSMAVGFGVNASNHRVKSDAKERRMINADEALKPIFNGKAKVSMFDMTKLVNKHLKDA